MKRIPVSQNFYLDEFMDIHSYLNDEDNGLSRIDFRIIDCTQFLRVKYGKPIFVNRWWKTYLKLE